MPPHVSAVEQLDMAHGSGVVPSGHRRGQSRDEHPIPSIQLVSSGQAHRHPSLEYDPPVSAHSFSSCGLLHTHPDSHPPHVIPEPQLQASHELAYPSEAMVALTFASRSSQLTEQGSAPPPFGLSPHGPASQLSHDAKHGKSGPGPACVCHSPHPASPQTEQSCTAQRSGKLLCQSGE